MSYPPDPDLDYAERQRKNTNTLLSVILVFSVVNAALLAAILIFFVTIFRAGVEALG